MQNIVNPNYFVRFFVTVASTIVLLCGLTSVSHAKVPDRDKIDLELFKKSQVDRSKGCSVVLWQSNRNPDTDKYAYIFFEKLDSNHVRSPAGIKISGQIVRLKRVATGGKRMGYDLYAFQLYKMAGRKAYVILELTLEEFGGETVDVDAGTMSVVMHGKRVFRSSIKGNAGCSTAAAPSTSSGKRAAAPAPEVNDRMLYRYDVPSGQVPKVVRAAVVKKYDCDTDVVKTGVVGYQLSEEAAIWEIPCARYAFQGTSAFALVYLPDPAQDFSFLSFEFPTGHKRGSGLGLLTSPQWHLKSRTVTSIALGRAQGDCGVLERHRLTEEGEFVLIEHRAKPNCDGKPTKPRYFPLVFRGN